MTVSTQTVENVACHIRQFIHSLPHASEGPPHTEAHACDFSSEIARLLDATHHRAVNVPSTCLSPSCSFTLT
jgi:hypothetical protein